LIFKNNNNDGKNTIFFAIALALFTKKEADQEISLLMKQE
jgi:hypothetical protein